MDSDRGGRLRATAVAVVFRHTTDLALASNPNLAQFELARYRLETKHFHYFSGLQCSGTSSVEADYGFTRCSGAPGYGASPIWIWPLARQVPVNLSPVPRTRPSANNLGQLGLFLNHPG
ncbi:MAG: hypothetical protein OEQ39_18730 [Gammaproteobacteria bacterium]|nr:hypothetical protein [Gammaproteobacteria bacterium]